VAELVPGVMEWARGALAHLAAGSLDDPRVRIRQGDVAKEIAAARASYDAILLDVDNGPDAFTRTSNHSLYTMEGLHEARRALKPGGLLAIWSAAPDRGFTPRLRHAGFAVEEVMARAHKGRGFRHRIWIATRAGGPQREAR
jgi:spermidine synthase